MSVVILDLLAPPTRAEWQSLSLSEQLERLRRHRLLPVALYHARAAGAELGAVLQGMWDSLLTSGRKQLAGDTALLARVIPALARRNCPVLLLKGAALGRWLYPAPELRLSSDVDLLVAPQRRLDAHAAMLDAGLKGDGYSQHDLASNQASYADPVTQRQIDLHWAMSVVPELACGFDFARLHERAQPVAFAQDARALGRVDSIMHTVIHYRAHMPPQDRPAIWLYDLALLVRGLDPPGWSQLDESVRRAGLAGLHAATLVEAARWFPLELPSGWIEQWQQAGHRECTRGWLGGEPHPGQRLLRSLRCLPGLRPRLRYLRARVFPAAAWMRGRYGVRSGWQLGLAYLRRWSGGLRRLLPVRA